MGKIEFLIIRQLSSQFRKDLIPLGSNPASSSNSFKIPRKVKKQLLHLAVVAEWLRRWTRNPLGSARAGSNPADCASFSPPITILLYMCMSLTLPGTVIICRGCLGISATYSVLVKPVSSSSHPIF